MKFVTVVAALSNFAIPFERRPRSSLCSHETQDAMNLHIDYRAFRRSPLPLLRHASQRLQVLAEVLVQVRCVVLALLGMAVHCCPTKWQYYVVAFSCSNSPLRRHFRCCLKSCACLAPASLAGERFEFIVHFLRGDL